MRRLYSWREKALRCRLSNPLRLALVILVASLPLLGAQTGAQNSSALLLPAALAYDSVGNLYIADANRHQVFEATLAGTLVVVAGTGTQGFAGDNGPAAQAQLNSPQGLAFGSDGTLYIADTGNARVRSVNNGVISTVAGTGTHGYSGDGGPAVSALLRAPTALAIDAAGSLLVCDSADHRIRRIANGSVATVAGNGTQGFSGDGAQATAAELDTPSALAVGGDGRIFVADSHNHRVRVVDPSGTITTFAGTGQRGYAGDGGAARTAQLASPRGLTLLPDGSLLVADTDNQRVRFIDAAGVISTLVGSGAEGGSSDGALAPNTALRSPRALATSSFGMLVIADALNHAVRVLTPGGALYQPAALAPGRASTLTAVIPSGVTYGTAAAALQVIAPIGSAQGQVAVLEGGQALASASLAVGTASLNLSAVNAGAHALNASYAGDGLNPATTLPLGSVTIAPAVVVATATLVSVEYGAPLPRLVGTISGVLPQDVAQVYATFNVAAGTALNVGSYPIAATLTGPRSGDYTLSGGENVGQLTVTQAGSRIALATLPQAYAGVPMLLSATVTSATSGYPTGIVQFLDGTNVIATAALVNGSASVQYTAAGAGTLNLSARYSGDTNFTVSSSLPQTATISSLPDFVVAVTGPATATVNGGTAATFNLLVTSQSGPFTGVVTLSVQGLPSGATASFSPVQVVPGNGSATVAATLLMPALAMEGDPLRHAPHWLALAGVGCGFFLLRRRKLRLLPLLSLCFLIVGCGARTVGETAAAAPKTYTLQLIGTSTNLVGAVITHTTPVTVTVQN